MTYEDLKAMPLNELLCRLREQVVAAQGSWAPERLCSPAHFHDQPALILIGDFEIRARFFTPKPVDSRCGFSDTTANAKP